MSPRSITHISQLATEGLVDPKIVETWIGSFKAYSGAGEETDFPLTSLQQAVVRQIQKDGDRGRNVIIAASTSSGKTLAAEIVMANELHRSSGRTGGCIYAVPLRALATEKYERFKTIFGPANTLVSSGDYQDDDARILNGKFQIAVVIYEKLFSWMLAQGPRDRLLQRMALVIVDEIQMIGETQRGPRLEMLLTFMNRFQRGDPSKRVIGMGPSGVALSKISNWLGATLLEPDDDRRPVPLVQGVLCGDGKLSLEPLDSRLSRDMVAIPPVAPGSREDMTKQLVRQLVGERVGEGKRILIYCATKDFAERTAREIADSLPARRPLAHENKDELDQLERTQLIKTLRVTLPHGVAIHHGDMTLQERLLVERLFRAPPREWCADIVLCTPTLAMGINLPADYMIFLSHESFRPVEWGIKVNVAKALTPLEYQNFAGRAGRYRPNMPVGQYGVALFVSQESQEVAEAQIVAPIIRAAAEPVSSALVRWPFGLESLLLGGGVLGPPGRNGVVDIRRFFHRSFATACGATIAEVADDEDSDAVSLSDAIPPRLTVLASQQRELISPETLEVSNAGTIVARAGIDIGTYVILKNIVLELVKSRDAEHNLRGLLERPLEILEMLARAPEIVRLYPTSLTDSAAGQADTAKALRGFFRAEVARGEQIGPIASAFIGQTETPGIQTLKQLIRVAAAWMWMQGESAEALTASNALPQLRYGACTMLGDQLHWLVSLLPDLWHGLGAAERNNLELTEAERDEVRWALGRLERQLRFGVPDYLVSLAQLRVPKMHRDNLGELWSAVLELKNVEEQTTVAWRHPVELLRIDVKKIGVPFLQRRLRDICSVIRSKAWFDDPRSVDIQQVDAAIALTATGPWSVSADWPAILEQVWKAPSAATLCRALRAAPFRLDPIEHQGESLLSDGSGAFLAVAWAAQGDTKFDQIKQLLTREGPGGKQVAGVVIVSPQIEAELATRVRGFGARVRLLSLEAFGELMISGLRAPDTRNAGVIRRIIDWVLGTSADALSDATSVRRWVRQNDPVVDSRCVEGRAGRLVAQSRTFMTHSDDDERLEYQALLEDARQFQCIRRVTPGLVKNWRDAMDALSRTPVEGAQRGRIAMEAMFQGVSQHFGVKGANHDAITREQVMTSEWHQLVSSFKQPFHDAMHPTVENPQTGAKVVRDFAFREVLSHLRGLLEAIKLFDAIT
jgi:replicative superfamily II helicase